MSPRNILGFPFFRPKPALCVLNDFLPANMKCLSPYQRNCKLALSGRTKEKSETLVAPYELKLSIAKLFDFHTLSYPMLV